MYRLLSVALFIASVSATVTSHGSSKGMLKPITYKYDPIRGILDEPVVKECTKPGTMCGNCQKLYECVQIGNDYLQQELEVCATGSTCLETPTTAYCTTGPNPGCDMNVYIFTCHQLGLFPDPFNCKKYHMCIPDEEESNGVQKESIAHECDGNFYYDPRTNLCRNKIVNNSCPAVAAPCTSSGQAGIISGNPALYFLCLKQGSEIGFFPNIFLCPNNKEYDLDSHSCIDPTPAAATGSDGKCLKVGLFYDPTNCFFYYQCTAVGGNPTRRQCSTRLYFEPKSQKCVDFACTDLNK